VPTKLAAVILLLALGLVLNLVEGALLVAGIQTALIFGILVGNDGIRTLLRGLALLSILTTVVFSAPALQAGAGPGLVLTAAVAVAVQIYVIWTLGQADVREWMFRKSFRLDDGLSPPGGGEPFV
jgi:hypothetical protein